MLADGLLFVCPMNRTILKSIVFAAIAFAAVVGCGDEGDSDEAPCGELQDGATLRPGESITSCSGSYLFINQNDGNVVLYRGVEESTRSPLWASNTVGSHRGVLTLRSGNLRLTDTSGKTLYESDTEGHPGATFIMQNDGNGVIYDSAKSAVWATNTVDSGGGSGSGGGGGGCKSNSDCHDKCKRCVLSTGACVSRLSC